MRTTSLRETFSNTTIRTTVLTGAVTETSSESTYVTLDNSRNDVVVNPKDSEGWRSPSPYFGSFKRASPALVSGTLENKQYRFTHQVHTLQGVLTDTQMQSLMPTYNEYAQAEVKALNRLADRKMSALETVAEMRQSVDGLSRNARSLVAFAMAAKRRDWKAAARAIGVDPASRRSKRAVTRIHAQGQSFGAAWLNYWFGIQPIVSDMVAIVGFMSDDETLRRLKVKSKGRFKGKTTRSGTVVPQNNYSLPWEAQIERTAFVSFFGKITAEHFRRAVTYGAVDVPATAWALAPWSFVIDWVLPVSEVLKAQTAGVGIAFKGGTRTLRVKSSAKTGQASVRTTGWDRTSVMSTTGTVEQLRFIRTVYTGWPHPVSVWIKDPFDLWKGVTSLALLANVINPKNLRR